MSRKLGSISTRYRRRLATNSSRNPCSYTLISDASCDLQQYYSDEEPYGFQQQRERPEKTRQKRMSVPSVAVSIAEECLGREKSMLQPSPFFQPRLRHEQQEVTEFSNLLVRHELLEKPVPEPFPEGCGTQAHEDMTRNGGSGVSRHHEGKAVIERNLEMASGSLLDNEIPVHVLLFDK